MAETLARMYVSLAPVIVAGVLNMVWCGLRGVAAVLDRPIDGGRHWRDGRRLFGENKTWKGLAGMVVLGAAAAVAWGALLRGRHLEELDLFYRQHGNGVAFNALVGALLGLAYALFELPNSFLKRRLGIAPGRTATGGRRWGFVALDQADSIVGCALVVAVFCPVSGWFLAGLVVVGAGTHIVVNVLLYAAHLRRNMF